MPGREAQLPPPRLGRSPPAATSCARPSSVQPGWAAQLRSGLRTGRKFRFPSAKRKEGNPSSNLKSLPTSHFHRLTLLSRVSETLHCPFPPSPSSPQHAGTKDCPSEGRLAEDSPSTVKASVLDDSRSLQSSRFTLESSCPGMQFLQGVCFPCSSRYSLSW